MYLSTVKRLSAVFDDVAKGSAKRYTVIRDGKPIASSYDRELAERIAAAYPGAKLEETEVFNYEF